MKLCRIGELGKEKPAIIDKDGSYKDLSSVISDLNPESLNLETLEKIKKLNIKDLPNLDASFEQGNVDYATNWLKENIQKYGGLRKPEETIAHAIRGKPDEEPLLQYLEEKFGDINS